MYIAYQILGMRMEIGCSLKYYWGSFDSGDRLWLNGIILEV